MFSKKTIQDAINTELAVSDKMLTAIKLWKQMYRNEADWLSEHVKSLNIASGIASELARMTTLEFESKIKGSVRGEFLEKQYEAVKRELRICTEYGCAFGGLIFKPYISGSGISVDYVKADSFFPVSFGGNGKITACVFAERKRLGEKYFTRLEYHRLEPDGVHITNRAFSSSQKNELGRPCPLSSVPEWSQLQEQAIITGTDRMLFGYFKYPAANTVDEASPLGVSSYSRATDLIREADRQYSRILWEYEGSELAVYADSTALERKPDGSSICPSLNRRLFKSVDLEKLFEVFNPEIRDAPLFHGLDEILKKIEFTCGLSYGIISDPREESKTATEIKSSKQRMYQTVSDIQGALQTALEDMIYAMDIWTSAGNLAPSGTYDVSFKWDDSIIIDRQAEQMQWLQEIRDGIRQKYEYRMHFFGEDEETAKRMSTQTMPTLFGEGD